MHSVFWSPSTAVAHIGQVVFEHASTPVVQHLSSSRCMFVYHLHS